MPEPHPALKACHECEIKWKLLMGLTRDKLELEEDSFHRVGQTVVAHQDPKRGRDTTGCALQDDIGLLHVPSAWAPRLQDRQKSPVQFAKLSFRAVFEAFFAILSRALHEEFSHVVELSLLQVLPIPDWEERLLGTWRLVMCLRGSSQSQK